MNCRSALKPFTGCSTWLWGSIDRFGKGRGQVHPDLFFFSWEIVPGRFGRVYSTVSNNWRNLTASTPSNSRQTWQNAVRQRR